MAPIVPMDIDYTGFAQGNIETLELLNKALSAGSGVDAGAFTGGRALIPESLDTTLVNILWTQDEARLFQRLKKQPIRSPVHQWDDRTDVGARDGAWVPEGGASIEADQTIARRYATAKYLQTLRKVTLQASISNMIENAMSRNLSRNLSISFFKEYLKTNHGSSSGDVKDIELEKRSLTVPDELFKLKEIEEYMVAEALKRSGGNQNDAARLLGLSPSALSRRIKKMGGKKRIEGS